MTRSQDKRPPQWPQDGDVQALLNYMLSLLAKRRLTQAAAARKLQLGKSTLSQFLSGSRLIGKEHLANFVDEFGGDPAIAEGLHQKAELEWRAARSGWKRESSDDITGSAPGSTGRYIYDGYIPRQDYHDEFDQLIALGHKLIALVGEPGNGKTRLADGLIATKLQPSDTRIYLPVNAEDECVSIILEELGRRGEHIYGATLKQVIPAFARMLCTDSAPKYVIIDNLEDSSLLAATVLPAARSVVVVTSRVNLLPRNRGVPIKVGPMTLEEACELGRSFLPNHSEEEVAQLAETVGYRPLAIDHASLGLIAMGMTIDQFCKDFSQAPAKVMRQAKLPDTSDPYQQSMTWMYEQILSRMRQRDVEYGTKVASLFELAAFVDNIDIPADLLQLALGMAVPPADAVTTTAEFISARRELMRLHLIDMHSEKFEIHQLTHVLVRDILRDRKVEICLPLFQLTRDIAKSLETDLVDIQGSGWGHHLSTLLRNLADVDQPGLTGQEIRSLVETFTVRFSSILSLNERMAIWVSYIDSNQISHHYDSDGLRLELLRPLPEIYVHDSLQEELLDRLYDTGRVSTSDYCAMQRTKYEILCDIHMSDAVTRQRRFALRAKIDLLSGELNNADALVVQLQELVSERLSASALVDGRLIEAYLTVGRIHLLRAQWSTGLGILADAIRLIYTFADSVPDAGYRTLEIMTAIVAGEIEQGKPKQLLEQNLDLLNSYLHYGQDPAIVRDENGTKVVVTLPRLMFARNVNIQAQALLANAIRDDTTTNLSKVELLHMVAADFLDYLGKYRDLLFLRYDRILCDLVSGVDAETVRHSFEELMRGASDMEEEGLALRCSLALIKLNIIEGTCTRRDITQSARIATHYAEFYARNDVADALGVSYVIAVMCGASNTALKRARRSASAAYATIGKMAKWELLAKAGTPEFDPLHLFLP